MKNLFPRSWLLLSLLTGCAGTERSCAADNATRFGADWVVVQMDLNGRPFRCWSLTGVSIANEPQSDGIYWEGPGGLVHISGHYNRIQVTQGWNRAYAELGLNAEKCRAIQNRSVPMPEETGATEDAGPRVELLPGQVIPPGSAVDFR